MRRGNLAQTGKVMAAASIQLRARLSSRLSDSKGDDAEGSLRMSWLAVRDDFRNWLIRAA